MAASLDGNSPLGTQLVFLWPGVRVTKSQWENAIMKAGGCVMGDKKRGVETASAGVSRRSFLSSLGAAGVVATAGAAPVAARAATISPPVAPADHASAEVQEGAIRIQLR